VVKVSGKADFSRKLEESSRNEKMLATLAGHGFGLDVIAEGVETERQKSLCRELGCNTMQGIYVSEPIPEGKFAEGYLRKK
jgi:EAL domain-containing protein (putative c-di-GMP-specific phosphodiesterase class I)